MCDDQKEWFLLKIILRFKSSTRNENAHTLSGMTMSALFTLEVLVESSVDVCVDFDAVTRHVRVVCADREADQTAWKYF
jgi:hypothetical protein